MKTEEIVKRLRSLARLGSTHRACTLAADALESQERFRQALVKIAFLAAAAPANEAVQELREIAVEALLPRSPVDPPKSKRPMCEECDEEMHPYDTYQGKSGWGCGSCGWSWDD